MIPIHFSFSTQSFNLTMPFLAIFGAIGVLGAIFLFWRAGRHEFLESEFMLDNALIAIGGALIGGRILEFVVNFEKFQWNLERLIFFNVWGGFNFWGALLGSVIGVFWYLKRKKVSFWQVFDLAVAPVTFAQMMVAIGRFIAFSDLLSLYFAVGYFLIFVILKRLAIKKRHLGFFASFWLFANGLLNIILFNFEDGALMLLGKYPFRLLVSIILLSISCVSWYILAHRKIKGDLRGAFAIVLLLVLKIVRVLRSVREANEAAKAIIFLPVNFGKIILFLVAKIWRESYLATRDFMHVLGIRK